MKIGIFGAKGCGKTTIFGLLTGLEPRREKNGKAQLGVVKVRDRRLDYLANIYRPKKTTYAEFMMADLPGASGGTLDAGQAAELRTMDVLTMVLRNFQSPFHDSPPDAVSELTAQEEELIIEDLSVVEKRLERLAKEKGKHGPLEQKLLDRCRQHLENSLPLRTMEIGRQEQEVLRGFQLLSLKRLIVLVNTDESEARNHPPKLQEIANSHGASLLDMCAKAEAEIMQLEPDERQEFLADLGVDETARERYLEHAYRELGLISFLTVGPDECRAWTIRAGTTARRAARVIHSDIERGFIRAEVISFDDFKACGGTEASSRAAGRYRLEGKDYLVKDGDIINFRFNV